MQTSRLNLGALIGAVNAQLDLPAYLHDDVLKHIGVELIRRGFPVEFAPCHGWGKVNDNGTRDGCEIQHSTTLYLEYEGRLYRPGLIIQRRQAELDMQDDIRGLCAAEGNEVGGVEINWGSWNPSLLIPKEAYFQAVCEELARMEFDQIDAQAGNRADPGLVRKPPRI